MSAVKHAPPPAAAVVHPPPGANPPQQASGLAVTGEQVLAAAKEKSEAKARNVWLHAWHDPVAGLKAYSQCVRLADLNANGESKLLVAGSDKKLKIYQGTTLLSENVLLDAPVSVCVFYPDANKPRMPSVAVAAGPFVFIYRNLRPYYKFSLPLLAVDEKENEVWSAINEGKISIDELKDQLTAVRDSGVTLTSRSQDLLALDDPGAAGGYVAERKGKPLQQQTVCTCMEVLKKDLEDDDAVSMLVVGTEAGQVLILDPPGATVQYKVQLVSAPVFMHVGGTLAVEWRVICACRDGNVYTIKNGELTGTVIELESMPCGLVRLDKTIVVGCMNSAFHAFHIKGKKTYSVYLDHPITCMETLSLTKTRNLKALLVALLNGEVRLYNVNHLVATLQVQEPITALRFGYYGREESAMIAVGRSGSLTIKFVQRTADLDVSSHPPGPPPEQDVPLSIPKKTKLYVEQTQREREQATEMHRVFQRDLCKLRLNTARAYVKIISDGQGPMSFSSGSSLRLTAQVQGLGPRFKLKLNLQNTGTRAVTDMVVTFAYNAMLYRLKSSLVRVPLLVPGLLYRLDAELDCIDETGGADAIRVFVCSAKSVLPVLSAVVNMPVSEVLLQQ